VQPPKVGAIAEIPQAGGLHHRQELLQPYHAEFAGRAGANYRHQEKRLSEDNMDQMGGNWHWCMKGTG
jgi:hypothetical protein